MILGFGFDQYLLKSFEGLWGLKDDNCRAGLVRLGIVCLCGDRLDIFVVGVDVKS